MNTCQTSIETSILLMSFGNPHPVYKYMRRRNDSTTELNKRGKSSGQTLASLIRIIASYWSAQPTNLSAF